jgi:hypothetical protein
VADKDQLGELRAQLAAAGETITTLERRLGELEQRLAATPAPLRGVTDAALKRAIAELEQRVLQRLDAAIAPGVTEAALKRAIAEVRSSVADDVLDLHRRMSERPSQAMQSATLEGLAELHGRISHLVEQVGRLSSAGPVVAPVVVPTAAPVADTVPIAAPAPPVGNGWQVHGTPGGVGVTPSQANGQQGAHVAGPGVISSTTNPTGGGWRVGPPPGAS